MNYLFAKIFCLRFGVNTRIYIKADLKETMSVKSDFGCHTISTYLLGSLYMFVLGFNVLYMYLRTFTII